MYKNLIIILILIMFIASCAVSPIQSSRIKSNLSVTSRISFSDANYRFFYESIDTSGYYQKGSVAIYPVNITEYIEEQLFSLIPFPSWGIRNRVELSGYIIPLFVLISAYGGDIKVNIFDFKGKQKLFRDIALAVNVGGYSIDMEWDEQKWKQSNGN